MDVVCSLCKKMINYDNLICKVAMDEIEKIAERVLTTPSVRLIFLTEGIQLLSNEKGKN